MRSGGALLCAIVVVWILTLLTVGGSLPADAQDDALEIGAHVGPSSTVTQADDRGPDTGFGPGPGAPFPSRGLVELGRYGGATRAVSADGDRVLVGVGTTIQVFRLDADGVARLQGAPIRMPGPVTGLEAAGGRVLVELGGEAVVAADLRGPGPPRVGRRIAGRREAGHTGPRMALSADGVAFVARIALWSAFDVGDVLRPRVLAQTKVESVIRGIVLDEDRLFVAADRISASTGTLEGATRLYAWDVARPQDVRPSGPAMGLLVGRVDALLDVGEGLALIVDAGTLTFLPVPIDAAWDSEPVRSVAHVSHAVAGAAVFVARIKPYEVLSVYGVWYKARRIVEPVDLSSPHPPVVRAMELAGDRLFVAYNDHGVRAFDVSDPGSPLPLGEPFADYGGLVADIALDEELAWLATAEGLRIVDLAGGREIGGLAADAPLLAVDVDNGRGVVAGPLAPGLVEYGTATPRDVWRLPSDESELQVVDAREPSRPILVGSVHGGGIPRDVLVEADRAYIAHRPGPVLVLDLGSGAADPPHVMTNLVRNDVKLAHLSKKGDRVWATWFDRTYAEGFAPGRFGLTFWNTADRDGLVHGGLVERTSYRRVFVPTGAGRSSAFVVLRGHDGSAGEDESTAVSRATVLGAMIDREGMHLVSSDASVELHQRPLVRLATIDLPLRAVEPGLSSRGFTAQRTDMVAQHGIAWIAAADAGLRGLDARLPDHPDEAAWLTGPESIVGVDAEGTVVAVAAGEDGAMLLRWTGWVSASQVWLPWVGR